MINLDSKKELIIGLFLVIFIIYIFTIYYNFSLIDDLIEGLWIGSPDFCSDAGLDSFILYIGEGSGSTHTCYILIQRNDKIFLNEPTELTIYWDWISLQNWSIHLNHGSLKHGTVKFNIPKITGFPNTQQISIYPTLGKMVLSDRDNIYACLYRSPELTEVSLEKNKQSFIKAPTKN